MARERNYCFREVLPFAAMIMVECTNVGLSTIFKAATLKGLSYHVFMCYSYVVGALVLMPFAFFFHRKTELPPLTITLCGKFFILGILGFTAQLLGYKGIDYASPTLGSAMSNLTPASTFLLAMILRMEKLELRKLSSQAKVVGTLVSIGGALVVVLYEGPVVIRGANSSSSTTPVVNGQLQSSSQSNWAIGGALLAADYIVLSLWYIFQSKVVKEYPAEFLLVFYYSVCAAAICAPVSYLAEPNLNKWKLKPDVGLVSILYSGIIGSFMGTTIHTWGLHVKGPLYVALFRPLSIAIAAIAGVIFLGDSLYLGSVIGAVFISFGFYIVLWGKTQEDIQDVDPDSPTSTENVPLLKGTKDDHQTHSNA